MRDIIYEESAVSTRQGKEDAARRALFICAVVLFVIAAYFLILLLWQINVYLQVEDDSKQIALMTLIGRIVLLVVFAAIGGLFLYIRTKFGVSYDYEFVSGELRISRAGKSGRTALYRISPEEFSKVGKVGSNEYYNLKRNKALRETRFTKNKTPAEGKDFYYILYSDHLGKQLFIIECREEMIRNIALYAARGTVEL